MNHQEHTGSAVEAIRLNAAAREIHQNAVNHGWWDDTRSFPEILALVHSELSEALEEYRDGRPMVYADNLDTLTRVTDPQAFRPTDKPEGIAIELADAVIRILDYCGHAGIDLDTAIRVKHRYNLTRAYRHGGKRA